MDIPSVGAKPLKKPTNIIPDSESLSDTEILAPELVGDQSEILV